MFSFCGINAGSINFNFNLEIPLLRRETYKGGHVAYPQPRTPVTEPKKNHNLKGGHVSYPQTGTPVTVNHSLKGAHVAYAKPTPVTVNLNLKGAHVPYPQLPSDEVNLTGKGLAGDPFEIDSE